MIWATRIVAMKYLVVICLLLAGCTPPSAPNSGVLAQLDTITKELEKVSRDQERILADIRDLRARHWWIGAPVELRAEQQAPNVQAAIGHALLAASDIVGRDAVVKFFTDMASDVVRKRVPLDAGGLINKKCQDDVSTAVNQLLSQ